MSAVRNYAGTPEYVWSNSETSANLDRSPSLTAGTVRLTILDIAGAGRRAPFARGGSTGAELALQALLRSLDQVDLEGHLQPRLPSGNRPQTGSRAGQSGEHAGFHQK